MTKLSDKIGGGIVDVNGDTYLPVIERQVEFLQSFEDVFTTNTSGRIMAFYKGYLFCCDNTKVFKYDAANGQNIVNSSVFADIAGMCIDDDGNVYIAENGEIHKLSGSNLLTLETYTAAGFNAAIFYYDNNIYACNRTTDIVTKFDLSLNKIWDIDVGSGPFCIDVDSDKNVYVGMEGGVTKKINSDGSSILWTETYLSGIITGIFVDKANGDFIIADDTYIKKYSSGKTLQWTVSISYDAFPIYVENNIVYVGLYLAREVIMIDYQTGDLIAKVGHGYNETINSLCVEGGYLFIYHNDLVRQYRNGKKIVDYQKQD